MTDYFKIRIVKLQKLLKKMDLDALIVYNGVNMKYLTGFDGGTGDGLVLVTLDNARLITDSRYEEDYKDRLPEGVDFKSTLR